MPYTDLDHPLMTGGHVAASGKFQYEDEPSRVKHIPYQEPVDTNEAYAYNSPEQKLLRAIFPTDGSEILTEAFNLINGDRGAAYGHPIHDYTRTCAIFKAMTGIDLKPEAAILFMMCVKISRLTNNMADGKWHRDSAVDIGGYLGCLAKVQSYRVANDEKFTI